MKLKSLSSKDHITIEFGEWFNKTYGNTYYDARVHINNTSYNIPYCYGYHAGSKQSIDEALAGIGYKLRSNKDAHKPYKAVHCVCFPKLKRELFK